MRRLSIYFRCLYDCLGSIVILSCFSSISCSRSHSFITFSPVFFPKIAITVYACSRYVQQHTHSHKHRYISKYAISLRSLALKCGHFVIPLFLSTHHCRCRRHLSLSRSSALSRTTFFCIIIMFLKIGFVLLTLVSFRTSFVTSSSFFCLNLIRSTIPFVACMCLCLCLLVCSLLPLQNTLRHQ